MSLELIAGILLAIKIIVFAVVILPMRKKLRFFTKKYLPIAFNLSAGSPTYLNMSCIKALHDVTSKYIGKFYREDRVAARNLHLNFDAVIDRHILLCIANCKEYKQILSNIEHIEELRELNYIPDKHIDEYVNFRLIKCINTAIEEKSNNKDSIATYAFIQEIKNTINETLSDIRFLKYNGSFISVCEEECLEDFLTSLRSGEVTIEKALIVADFTSTIALQDHSELVNKIRDIVSPILKKNPNVTILEKYPWIYTE